MANFLWITNTEENVKFYSDSAPRSDLCLHFEPGIDTETKGNVCRFVRYLRREFYFPIRCNVYFCNKERFHSSKGGYCYGVFYPNDGYRRLVYPQIYIPAKSDLYSIYSSLGHELTHYFQWYFMDDQRSARSLEIQASKYANRILEDYCCYDCKSSSDKCRECCQKLINQKEQKP